MVLAFVAVGRSVDRPTPPPSAPVVQPRAKKVRVRDAAVRAQKETVNRAITSGEYRELDAAWVALRHHVNDLIKLIPEGVEVPAVPPEACYPPAMAQKMAITREKPYRKKSRTCVHEHPAID